MEFWHYNKVVGININKKLGNTNTSDKVSEFLVNLINFDDVTKETTFLEPAAGAGSFYFSIVNSLVEKGFLIDHIVENMVYAFDIDPNALSVLKNSLESKYNYLINENTKIFNANFLTFDLGNLKFDYVITNPPYISNKNIEFEEKYETKENYIKTIKNLIDNDIMNVSDIYIYFHIKALNILKDRGRSIFLCSDSWIDSKFGNIIKKYILNKEYNLDLIVNSQLYPFFRDDTNAILTVISKSTNDKTSVVNLREELKNVDFNKISSFELSKKDLFTLLHDKNILNKRNALILFYDYFFSINNFYVENKDLFTNLNNDFIVETTSLTQASMSSANMLIDYRDDICPIFWQIQARVNKLPNYKNQIFKDELVYCVNVEKIPEKFKVNFKNNNFYISNVIDRFPLLFNVDHETFHVSKYFSLEALDKNSKNLESIARIHSIYSILDMELNMKEGTRKTLRKGECGLAKEIKKSDLEAIRIPINVDFSDVSKNIKDYSEKVIYNLETALLDQDYISIQKHITNKLGLTVDDLKFVIKNALFLYVLRMRNIKKIINFEEYYSEMLEKIDI